MNWIIVITTYATLLALNAVWTFQRGGASRGMKLLNDLMWIALLVAGSLVCGAVALLARWQQVEWMQRLLVDWYAIVWLPLPLLLGYGAITSWWCNRPAAQQAWLDRMNRPGGSPPA